MEASRLLAEAMLGSVIGFEKRLEVCSILRPPTANPVVSLMAAEGEKNGLCR